MIFENVLIFLLFNLIQNVPLFNGVKYFDVEKGKYNTKNYKGMRLENGLKVLLINDPEATKSGASLEVAVGSGYDPIELPGLAHFLEHLLFLGTKKFPDDSQYSKFLSNHGGYSNAYTSYDHTNYHFQVNSDQLIDALDMFSEFFKSSLLLQSSMEKEVNAVNSEYLKDLQNDDWRLGQLQNTLVIKDHPLSKFTVGNYDSLWATPKSKNIDIHKEIVDFYKEHYSSDIMTLVILGKESIENLSKKVIELFSDIPKIKDENKKQIKNIFSVSKSKDQLKTLIKAKSLGDGKKLELRFQLKTKSNYIRTAPDNYITHLIGHESKGSILYLLKDKGWANQLDVDIENVQPNTEWMLIGLSLTQEGFKNYEKIISIIFSYIKKIKELGPKKWIFEEIIKNKKNSFDFIEIDEVDGYVSSLSSNIQKINKWYKLDEQDELKFNDSEWLKITSYPTLYSEKDINDVFSQLTLNNSWITLISNDEIKNSSKEKWFGTEYVLSKYPSSINTELKLLNLTSFEDLKMLNLPNHNEFLPENFDLIKVENNTLIPVYYQIKNIDGWLLKNDNLALPKLSLNLLLNIPIANSTLSNFISLNLFTKMLNNKIKPKIGYYANLASITYLIHAKDKGIFISISGYRDKFNVFVKSLLEIIKTVEFKEADYNLAKEQLINENNDFPLRLPYDLSTIYLNSTLIFRWKVEENISKIEELTFKQFQNNYGLILKSIKNIQVLMAGNVNDIYFNDTLKIISENIKFERTTIAPKRSRKVPIGSELTFAKKLKNQNQNESAIKFLLQFGEYLDIKMRSSLQLIAFLMDEPCFTQLRTKEQLGYVVSCSRLILNPLIGLTLTIQSSKSPSFLETRIEEFLKMFYNTLKEMKEEEFENNKQSLIKSKLDKFTSISDLMNYEWPPIDSGNFDFNRKFEEIESIKALKKDEMLSIYEQKILNKESRSKLSIHLSKYFNSTNFINLDDESEVNKAFIT